MAAPLANGPKNSITGPLLRGKRLLAIISGKLGGDGVYILYIIYILYVICIPVIIQILEVRYWRSETSLRDFK
jgi:hypothetical protein